MSIAGRPMIVGGAQCCEHKSGKDADVGPSLTRINESLPRNVSSRVMAKEREAQNPDYGKRDIRNDVPEVRNTQPTTLIREQVVRSGLRKGRKPQHQNGNADGQSEHQRNSVLARKQVRTSV